MLESKVPAGSSSVHAMILSAFLVLCLTLLLKMDLLSSEAYYLQPKPCVFLAWLQLLPPPPLLFCSFLPWMKRQRKGKKMEEGNMVANIVTTSPDSLFLSLEKVTLATVTLSLSLPLN